MKMGKVRRKVIKKWHGIIGVSVGCVLLLTMVLIWAVRINAMEFGGFDVEVEVGEELVLPENWEDVEPEPGSDHAGVQMETEDNAERNTGSNIENNVKNNTEIDTGNDAKNNVQSNTKTNTKTNTGNVMDEKRNEILVENPAMQVGTAMLSMEGQDAPDGIFSSPEKAYKEASAVPAALPAMRSALPTEVPAVPVVGPTITPVTTLAAAPVTVSAVSPTIIPIVTTEPVVVKTELFTWSDTWEGTDGRKWEVQADTSLHILSFRLNGIECSWSWEDDSFTLPDAEWEAKNSVEIIALCGKRKEIMINPVEGIDMDA